MTDKMNKTGINFGKHNLNETNKSKEKDDKKDSD